MALNQAQLNELSKLEGFEKGFSKGEKVAATGMGEMALVIIPGGGVIKIGRAGSKLAAAAYKRLANAFGSKVKLIKKPTAAQIKKAQPPSTVLKADGTPKANVTLKTPTQVATNRLAAKAAQKREAQSRMRPTATVEKVTPPPRAPGLAKNRQKISPQPKANVKSTRKLAEDVKAAAAKRAAQQRMRTAQKVAKPAAVAAGLGAAAAGVNQATKPRKAAASKRKATGTYDRSAVATSKPKRKATGTYERRAVPTGGPKRKPTGTYDRSAVATSKPKRKPTGTYDRKAVETGKPKRKPTGTYDRTPVATSRPKPVTAGANVGFGPKGNIFPKDAADRRRLMAKYGGTGSAAARAAAQGKQGNLKKGSK